MTFFYNTLQVIKNQAVLAIWFSCSRKMREKDELKGYHWCVHLQKTLQHGITEGKV